MSTLDQKFKHSDWFLNYELSKKQVIEFIACNKRINNFALKENVLVRRDGTEWQLEQEELHYLKKRFKFYEEYYKKNPDANFTVMRDEIPEYKSLYDNFQKNEYERYSNQVKKKVYKVFLLLQRLEDNPSIITAYISMDKDEAENELNWIKEYYNAPDRKILNLWIEEGERRDIGEQNLCKVYVRTNQKDINDYFLVGTFLKEENAGAYRYNLEKNANIIDTKIEIENFREDFYKKICESYIATVEQEILLINPRNNNSIVHAHISDSGVKDKYSGKITIDNFKDYIDYEDKYEGEYYEYETYEDFYEEYVKDFIVRDIQKCSLFRGNTYEWNFYLTYNDLKKLDLEVVVNDSLIEELLEELEEESEEQQDV